MNFEGYAVRGVTYSTVAFPLRVTSLTAAGTSKDIPAPALRTVPFPISRRASPEATRKIPECFAVSLDFQHILGAVQRDMADCEIWVADGFDSAVGIIGDGFDTYRRWILETH